MATMTVQPRSTPAERADENMQIEVDEPMTVFAATIDDWWPRRSVGAPAARGRESGPAKSVDARILFVSGDEQDGIAKSKADVDRGTWRCSTS